MVTKKFGVDYGTDISEDNYGSLAYTLNPEEALENHDNETGEYTRTHADGWTITGFIVEDWAYWINDFHATHPLYGEVYGNFEVEVHATSDQAFEHFYEHHTPIAWDYYDI